MTSALLDVLIKRAIPAPRDTTPTMWHGVVAPKWMVEEASRAEVAPDHPEHVAIKGLASWCDGQAAWAERTRQSDAELLSRFHAKFPRLFSLSEASRGF